MCNVIIFKLQTHCVWSGPGNWNFFPHTLGDTSQGVQFAMCLWTGMRPYFMCFKILGLLLPAEIYFPILIFKASQKKRKHPHHLFTACSISGTRKTCKSWFHIMKCIVLSMKSYSGRYINLLFTRLQTKRGNFFFHFSNWVKSLSNKFSTWKWLNAPGGHIWLFWTKWPGLQMK